MTGVVELERALADSICRSDAAAAGRLLADDFVLASTGGVSPNMPRNAWLAALSDIETRSLTPEILDAREFGDVMVARVLVRWDATIADRDLSGSYAITDVFRREDGDWRLAWRISVRLPED